jgi:Uncharacterized protein, homolog of phage Mu protein gp30
MWRTLVAEARRGDAPNVEANARAFATRLARHVESRWQAASPPGSPPALSIRFIDDTAQRWTDTERQAAGDYWRRVARPAQVTAYTASVRADAEGEEPPVAEALLALYLLLQDKQRRARQWVDELRQRVGRKAKRVLKASKGRIINAAQLGRRLDVERGVARRAATNGAETQIGDAYAAANTQLATQTQSTGYVWLRTTSQSPRERHLTRVGQVFAWDAPPDGGHPGTEKNCKCGVRPIWSDTTEAQKRRWVLEANLRR